MIEYFDVEKSFREAMDKNADKFGPLTCNLDSYKYLPNGGLRVTVTVLPKNAKPVDPYKVGTLFQIKSRTYKVTGKGTGYKYSILCVRQPDGRRFRVTPQSVVDGFIGMS